MFQTSAVPFPLLVDMDLPDGCLGLPYCAYSSRTFCRLVGVLKGSFKQCEENFDLPAYLACLQTLAGVFM